MARSLSPALRRRIIDFDPAAPTSVSITDFCAANNISRKTYYTIKDRYTQQGHAALYPHSSAPHNPATRYGHKTRLLVLTIRDRLANQGWDNGPQSIYYDMLDDPDITPPIPSPATIARILRAAGVVDNNPRKRPRSALIRFSRPYAMQLWQLDAFSYRLAGGGTITIYHVVDDATRYDVGTYCAADSENSTDACRCLARAFDTYGVPQQLLTDNGTAFNQSRRGRVTIVQRFAADRGCQAIAGRVDHPQTQGKTERCHQTLQRFLDAHQPRSLAQARRWVEDFRDRYNRKRRHQSLHGATPQQAWDSLEHHPSTGKPVPLDDIPTTSTTTTAASQAADTTADANPEQHPTLVRLQRSAKTRINFPNYRVTVPQKVCGKEYYLVHAEHEYALFDGDDGQLMLRIALPLTVPGVRPGKTVPLWKVQGAWLRDAPRSWEQRRQQWLRQHNL